MSFRGRFWCLIFVSASTFASRKKSFLEHVFLSIEIGIYHFWISLDFFVRTLNNWFNKYFRLGVELVKLLLQLCIVMVRIDQGYVLFCHIWLWFLCFLYNFESMWICEKTCQFPLKMIGLSRVFINIMLNSDLMLLDILPCTFNSIYERLPCRKIQRIRVASPIPWQIGQNSTVKMAQTESKMSSL